MCEYTVYHDSNKCNLIVIIKGFMQDQIIVSHTCFGGYVVVNC